MKRTILTFAAAALALGAISQGSNPLAKLEGKPAPAFKMTDINGKVLTNQNLKGKVVLLDFWATWCGPCKAASPTMQALHKKYASKGLVVVGANTFDGSDGKQKSVKYAKEHNYSYTFTYGNDQFASSLGIRGIPAFIYIGKDGKIAKTQIGFGESMAPQMEATVKGLLSK
jgi:thiol-disulfide isomerase/thioredoxin